MVSNVTIAFSLLAVIVSLVVPVGAALWWGRKTGAKLKTFAVGALGFVISQIILRVPLLAVLGTQSWFVAFSQNHVVWYMLFIGITAGLFETFARFIGLRYLLKNKLTVNNGVAYGIGHGGIEAMFLSSSVMILDFFVALWLRGGVFLENIAAMPEPLQQLFLATQERVLQLSPDYFLASGVERILAVIGHVGLTMLVLKAVRDRKPVYFAYALLLHAGIDSFLPLLYQAGWNIWAIEFIVALKAAFALYLVQQFKREEASHINRAA